VLVLAHSGIQTGGIRKVIATVGGVIEPHVIVLFGATGDLARRKLLPALFRLGQTAAMPEYAIVGTSTTALTDQEFRALARDACEEFGRGPIDPSAWEAFADRLTWADQAQGPSGLAAAVARAGAELSGEPCRLHYLSVPPGAAHDVLRTIDEAGLVERSRVVLEKPFGSDLSTARELNAALHEVFGEEQIFRIDHYLGKEAAQNILALRFANGLFEPIWNRHHIDHVQIDVPESIGLEGRGAFYEQTGAYRDMVVTHLLQVLGFVAMEPPPLLAPGSISEEKDKVFRSLQPIDPATVVRGQYEGFCFEPGVDPDCKTETFIALRCEVDNWRWAGVPFYLRTGKRMAERARIISIAFNEPPQSMFPPGSGVGESGPDHLTFDLEDESRVSLSFYGKRPGPGIRLEKLSMQFSMSETEHYIDSLEAYERLILDAMAGDHTLFTTADGIERLWEVSAPLLESPPEVIPYPVGSWGPEAVHDLIAPKRWRLPFERRWREASTEVVA
jgi:glucose-6-phosphate 1-dehydrogenase